MSRVHHPGTLLYWGHDYISFILTCVAARDTEDVCEGHMLIFEVPRGIFDFGIDSVRVRSYDVDLSP